VSIPNVAEPSRLRFKAREAGRLGVFFMRSRDGSATFGTLTGPVQLKTVDYWATVMLCFTGRRTLRESASSAF
jgi:hypothetical protein